MYVCIYVYILYRHCSTNGAEKSNAVASEINKSFLHATWCSCCYYRCHCHHHSVPHCECYWKSVLKDKVKTILVRWYYIQFGSPVTFNLFRALHKCEKNKKPKRKPKEISRFLSWLLVRLHFYGIPEYRKKWILKIKFKILHYSLFTLHMYAG